MNKNKQTTIKTNLELIAVIAVSILLFFLSIFSIDQNVWVWQTNDTLIQKIVAVTVAISGILGVISIILFAKKNKLAFIMAITNALFYSLFCIVYGLVIDFTIQISYIVILFILWMKSIQESKKLESKKRFIYYRNSIFSTIFYSFLTVIIAIIFFFVNPYTNKLIILLFSNNYIEFGSNFNYKIPASIILATINAISVVALIMMALGFRESWVVWCFKNIFCFVFFSGVGFLNITVLVINIIYFLLSIYLFAFTSNDKQFKIAFIGMGASGKSTIIKAMEDFWKENNVEIISERKTSEQMFFDYMSDLKKYGYQAQKNFFKDRYEQIKQMQLNERTLIDRHLIDDFIFPNALMRINAFDKHQSKKWNYFWKYVYKIKLSMQPKVDLAFVILKNYNWIEQNRIEASKKHAVEFERNRRKIEAKNEDFFRAVNAEYFNSENNTLSPELLSNLKKYSKKYYVFIDWDKDETIPMIKTIVLENLNNEK
ncbi:nicotinamide mononucleotide transporter [Mycoplasma simbae]|uniref:nicotinamide mononucleotide transporter n=1 Tax=Mycoplasma simbae TaxID=36744 RepID=UPI000497BCF8|nr:nicotinamide mononucleotide transporter [Mycoplasma simbae]